MIHLLASYKNIIFVFINTSLAGYLVLGPLRKALQQNIVTALYKLDVWRYKHIFITFDCVLSGVFI